MTQIRRNLTKHFTVTKYKNPPTPVCGAKSARVTRRASLVECEKCKHIVARMNTIRENLRNANIKYAQWPILLIDKKRARAIKKEYLTHG